MLILFDLDDTLFDHAFAFDAATTALHAAHGSSRAREDFASVGLELGIVTNGELENSGTSSRAAVSRTGSST